MAEMKACDFCGETILAVAKKCKHCGEFLDLPPNTDNTQAVTKLLSTSGKTSVPDIPSTAPKKRSVEKIVLLVVGTGCLAPLVFMFCLILAVALPVPILLISFAMCVLGVVTVVHEPSRKRFKKIAHVLPESGVGKHVVLLFLFGVFGFMFSAIQLRNASKLREDKRLAEKTATDKKKKAFATASTEGMKLAEQGDTAGAIVQFEIAEGNGTLTLKQQEQYSLALTKQAANLSKMEGEDNLRKAEVIARKLVLVSKELAHQSNAANANELIKGANKILIPILRKRADSLQEKGLKNETDTKQLAEAISRYDELKKLGQSVPESRTQAAQELGSRFLRQASVALRLAERDATQNNINESTRLLAGAEKYLGGRAIIKREKRRLKLLLAAIAYKRRIEKELGESGEDDAFLMAKQFVTKGLKSPKSADFGEQSSGECVTSLGGGKFVVKGYVDAKNAFNAEIRDRFVVTIQYKGNGKWQLQSLNMR